MQQYPSIQKNIIDVPIYAFDKLDGSNIRVEWTFKNGFSKFGSRKRLLSTDDTLLGEAIPLFEKGFSKELEKIVKTLKVNKATFFLEFYGENSFAGRHEDEEHELALFDVFLEKKGFLEPKTFLKLFEDQVKTPELLYTGKPNSNFVESVKNNSLDGITFEGVVCKSQQKLRNRDIRFKVKTDQWLQKLKGFCKGDERLFQELA